MQLHLLLTLLLAAVATHGANPVTAPILRNQLGVHTRLHAQLPWEEGSPAKIICIKSRPGSRDLYVCTLTKIYRIAFGGTVSLLIDVAASILHATGRRISLSNRRHGGVRAVAFHPNFLQNRLLYVAAVEERPTNRSAYKYISDTPFALDADSVLLEFKYNPVTRRTFFNSYRCVFRVGMPVFDHPIKDLAFQGPLLFISHGDGSVQSAIAGGGRRNDALGKVLRIDPIARGGQPYTVPQTNPFVGKPNMKNEVWALGFRNPHTMCIGRDGTIYVSDAGRSNIEEVNIVLRGKDYGWPEREGTFVHVGGGLVSGVRPLPWNDNIYNFEYPAAQLGHEGPVGAGFIGQAIAGGCPVENGSPMSGSYFYTDFPETGNLYFSRLSEMRQARRNGNPGQLTQARTRQANVWYDHDRNFATPPRRFGSLGDAMRSEPGRSMAARVDVRMGRGSIGELYWSSKTTGKIYVFTSSYPWGPVGPR